MDQARQDSLFKYLKYLGESHATSIKIGNSVKYVAHFLEHTESLSRKGYMKYKSDNGEGMSRNYPWNDCILDYLSFIGVGYNRKKRTVKALEKRSAISERNQQKVNEFASWLSREFDFSKGTMDSYVTGVRLFFEYADRFSNENVKRYLKTMEEHGKKPSTICLRISCFEKYAEWAKIPISIKRPKSKQRLSLENVPTEKEYNRLIEFLKTKPDRKYYLWVRILATTGARVHEFQKITWEDIVHGEVVLKGKGSKYRRFFFQGELQREVMDYVKETKKSGNVATNRHGGVITQRGIDALLKDWGEHVNIDRKKMHCHAFRHFFAKMYLKKNKDIIQLADLLGHGSIDTTRIYLQKSYDEQQRDFNRNVTW